MPADSIDWRNSTREKLVLLDLARRAFTLAVMHQPIPHEFPADEALSRPGGAFVTLRHRGRLRGCIGQFTTDLPLAQVIVHCAAAAACEDPRFRPVQPQVLGEIEIEISILSSAMEIEPGEIEIGRHGLIVSCGDKRGVLLPQVASQYKWSPERFLQETCGKAGLDRNAWKLPGTRVEAFTAETFSESDHQRAADQSLNEPQPDEKAATKRGYSTST
jgi:AmmeMemoRadiSam system protein A